MSQFHTFAAQTFNLGASIGSTDSSILLSSFTEPVTGVPYTMALLNTNIVYGTIAPKTSQKELISFTGITQNSNGTATLTGVVRGLAMKYPFASDSAYKLPHSGQTQFIISDSPQVFEEYPSITADVTITGQWTFTKPVITPANPVATTSVLGVGKVSVAPVDPLNPIFIGQNDPKVPTADPTTLFAPLSSIIPTFGDGSDGNITISSPTTLTRDMYYNNLIVNSTLNTANFRIFVAGTLSGNGTIQNNGGNGGNASGITAGAAGTAVSAGYFTSLPGLIGGAGSNNGINPGTNGSNSSLSIGVNGVAGGSGGVYGAVPPNPTTGGTTTGILERIGQLKWQTLSALDLAINGTLTKYNGSASSGSGGGGDNYNGNSYSGGGGGSGAPGGIIYIAVNIFSGTFSISVTGGNGGNGGNAAGTQSGGGGGGGGGSGGVSYIIYNTKSWAGSYVLTGGTGGTGGTGNGSMGASSNGTNGTTGISYEFKFSNLL